MIRPSTRPAVLLSIAFLITLIGMAALPNQGKLAAQDDPANDPAACAPARAAFAPGESTRNLTSGGRERSYLLYVPKSYDPSQRMPLVISYHGFTSNSADQAALTHFAEVAEEGGFIVAFPQGLTLFPFPARWNAGINPFVQNDPTDDVQFTRDMIAQLEETLCIDPARIYANGFSNGGGMTNRLACELSDQIAAVGGVAGAYIPIPGGCNPTRPVPWIMFHGDADTFARPEGFAPQGLPRLQDWVDGWLARNGCTGEPEIIPAQGDASGTRYTCAEDTQVVFYWISEGGHSWPGGREIGPAVGKTSQDIDASRAMWAFFQQFSLPE